MPKTTCIYNVGYLLDCSLLRFKKYKLHKASYQIQTITMYYQSITQATNVLTIYVRVLFSFKWCH